jgi:hypothetical protein
MELKDFIFQQLVGSAKVRVFDIKGKLISEHDYLNDYDLHFRHAFEKPTPRKRRPRIKKK